MPKKTKTTTKSRQKDPLSVLFGAEARAIIIRLFVIDPSRVYYQRQIEQATGLAIRGVQRELDRLVQLGLLYRREEGNRSYYQVDVHCPIFPELHGLVLKTAEPSERLRGLAAQEAMVRLAFLNESDHRFLLVYAGPRRPQPSLPPLYKLETLSMDDFLRALQESPDVLRPFLLEGVDILGRREDVAWRRIEAAGFTVAKAKGVA